MQKEVICNLSEEKISTCGNTTNMVKVSNMYIGNCHHDMNCTQ